MRRSSFSPPCTTISGRGKLMIMNGKRKYLEVVVDYIKGIISIYTRSNGGIARNNTWTS